MIITDILPLTHAPNVPRRKDTSMETSGGGGAVEPWRAPVLARRANRLTLIRNSTNANRTFYGNASLPLSRPSSRLSVTTVTGVTTPPRDATSPPPARWRCRRAIDLRGESQLGGGGVTQGGGSMHSGGWGGGMTYHVSRSCCARTVHAVHVQYASCTCEVSMTCAKLGKSGVNCCKAAERCFECCRSVSSLWCNKGWSCWDSSCVTWKTNLCVWSRCRCGSTRVG